MALGISSILFALALVLILSFSGRAQTRNAAGHTAAFRHITPQAQVLTADLEQDGTFIVRVFHPAGRSDFENIEQSVRDIAGDGKLPIEYHTLNTPETADLLRQLKIRMALDQTLAVIQAPNGTLTWGGSEMALANVDPDIVFPTPRMCEIIKAAQSGRDVLLVFTDDNRANGEQLVKAATAYVETPTNEAELFVIDPDDPANQDIIARTKLPADSLKDARLLLLVGGQIQGQMTGTSSLTGNDIAALKKSCSGKAGCC